MATYLPSTIIPLVDQLWLPTSDTSFSYANIDQLSVDTKGLNNQQVKDATEANFARWKSETFTDTDRSIVLFLYNLRFQNVTLKQSLQQWIYPIHNEDDTPPPVEEIEPGQIVETWEDKQAKTWMKIKKENDYTNNMCQMYQRDMLNFVKDKTHDNAINIENVDLTPSLDLFTNDELKMRRVVCIPIYVSSQKRLYFIHTCHSSFQYEIKQQHV